MNPRAFGMGFNAVLFTTHRQNFLVPPRAHRSFPLAEYLTEEELHRESEED
jgi:hypothetical protein